jgi:hypothetical protein
VFDFAQEVLSSISLTGVNPNNRQAAFDSIHADIAAANRGYKESVEEAARNQVGLQA